MRTFPHKNPDENVTSPNVSEDDAILDIEFNENGTEVWLSYADLHVDAIETETWHVKKNAASKRYRIKSLSPLSTTWAQEIIRKPLASLWFGVTITGDLVVLFEQLTESTIIVNEVQPWNCSSVKHLSISSNNEQLALTMADGSLKIYSIEYLLRAIFETMKPHRSAIDQQSLKLGDTLRRVDQKVNNMKT